MSYPTDKETYPRRETDDIIPKEDHNDVVDLLERLQDILGYNFLNNYSDLSARLDSFGKSTVSTTGAPTTSATSDTNFQTLDLSDYLPDSLCFLWINLINTSDTDLNIIVEVDSSMLGITTNTDSINTAFVPAGAGGSVLTPVNPNGLVPHKEDVAGKNFDIEPAFVLKGVQF